MENVEDDTRLDNKHSASENENRFKIHRELTTSINLRIVGLFDSQKRTNFKNFQNLVYDEFSI